ncbi:SDR family NAD(P)-dependent oxidoreductase [Paenibacillus flagellatus]|uniref:Ketoreductase domain-containing protein n=1 Tax=Paenibacillus flagellatus TaxID=2211139 RepID=A0A2V5L0R7_9BACL|nr:SDR family oxidoreductase [Paenibacillus flagellatus]PYI56186.1 hypothetical protein DLM86_04140 [Paenibacillus flagellatus]
MKKLEGKVALVTGGGRGIGRGIAERLAAAGAFVVVNDIVFGEDAGAEVEAGAGADGSGGGTAERAADGGGRLRPYRADISVKREADAMIESIRKERGRLDIVVNNAAICPFRDFFDIDERTWSRTVQVNLSGAFFCSQAAARVMREGGGGAIVQIGTVTSLRGGAQQVHYAASKAGLNGLTVSMANALAPYGIRVNAILCGGVPTEMNKEQRAAFSAGRGKRGADAVVGAAALRRSGTPADVGKAVLFLVSDDSEWVTGALYAVDGGEMAR